MPVAVVLAFAGVIAAGVLELILWNDVHDDGAITTVAGMVRVDPFGVFLGVVVVIATFLAVLLSIAYLRREGLESSEYLGLLLLSGAGMLAMTTANDLIVVFLALEVLSIPLYVLAAFDRRRASSQEAGIKYFVLGAFSSAVFLYGVALTYGATGTTSLTGIHDFLAQNTLLEQGTLLAGFALLLVGLGFKVAAVPFHMWTPDVYQGARRRSPPSCRRRSRPRRSPRCCACSGWRSRSTAPTGGRRSCALVGRCRSSSGAWPRSSRPTSSACWRTRRSRMPGTC